MNNFLNDVTIPKNVTNQMFVNRINIIIDTPNDISKYLELKSVNPPSTIPIPPGINDKTPNIIEV